MINFIGRLLTPTKAHRLGLNYTCEAERLFRRLACDLELDVVRTATPVELSMEFPSQPKLKAPVWVSLLSRDALQFEVEDFTCEMFPYEEVVGRFETFLRALLKGEARIQKVFRTRDGKVFRSNLQMNEGGEWKTVYRYGRLISLLPTLNYGVRFESLTHDSGQE